MELEEKGQQWVYYRNPNIDHGIRLEIENYASGNTYVSRTRLS